VTDATDSKREGSIKHFYFISAATHSKREGFYKHLKMQPIQREKVQLNFFYFIST